MANKVVMFDAESILKRNAVYDFNGALVDYRFIQI